MDNYTNRFILTLAYCQNCAFRTNGKGFDFEPLKENLVKKVEEFHDLQNCFPANDCARRQLVIVYSHALIEILPKLDTVQLTDKTT